MDLFLTACYLFAYLLSVTVTFRSNTELKMADDKGIKCTLAGDRWNSELVANADYLDGHKVVELKFDGPLGFRHVTVWFGNDEWLAFANKIDSITRIVSDAGREAISR